MRSDAKENRDAILQAAARLFTECGSAVSMRTIALEAGVGKGTLYRHFPHIDDLVLGIIQQHRLLVVKIVENATKPEEWEHATRELAQLQLGALFPALGALMPAGLKPGMDFLADQVEQSIGAMITRAQTAGLMNPDVTVSRYLLGLVMATKPLPPQAPEVFRAETGWVLENYIDSLRA